MEQMSVKSYISIPKLQRLHRITNLTPHFTGQEAKQSKNDKRHIIDVCISYGIKWRITATSFLNYWQGSMHKKYAKAFYEWRLHRKWIRDDGCD